jgi:UPF0755 protein
MINRRMELYAVFGGTALLWLFLAVVFLLGQFTGAVSSDVPLTFEVKKGESFTIAARRLRSEGVLASPGLLRLLAVLRGDAERIKAGEYALAGDESVADLLDFLVAGKARFVSLTVPEGFSIRDIANRIELIDLADKAEFLRLATDPEFIASLKIPARLGGPAMQFPTLEGVIFPETYFLHRGVSPRFLITRMVQQYVKRANDFVLKHAQQVGLEPYQVLILASIIEKETGLDSERRRISAVFHNRLKAKIKLGSDPTVIYGIKDFDGNLTRKHLRAATPYNTYKIYGLPPTPIANPGMASLKAAVNPEAVDYLYFVSKGDGSHFFSKDLKTHNRAVWKYQKRRYRKRQS